MHKFYERLLRLYPASYRAAYAEQMAQTLQDMLADQPSRAARARIWVRAGLDVAASIVRQHMLAAQQTTALQTNRDVRFGSALGGSLLLPFIIILAGNAVARLGFNRDLYHSWLWSTPVLTTWIVILPAAALLVAVVEYVRVVHRQPGKPWLRRLVGMPQVWPLILIIIVGLGVLLLVVFHDSTHCLFHNPVVVLHNPHDTLQCIRRGMFGG